MAALLEGGVGQHHVVGGPSQGVAPGVDRVQPPPVAPGPRARHPARHHPPGPADARDRLTHRQRLDRPGAAGRGHQRSGRKALVLVAHDADVAVVGGQQQHEVVLDPVRVLVLVDQDVLEPLLVVAQHVGVLAQQAQGLAEQVVEVHGAGPQQPVLVLAEDLRDLALEQVAGALGVGPDVDAVVLGRADGGMHRPGREPLGVEGQVTDDVAGQPHRVGLVVDGEGPGEAQLVGVAAQHADAGRVERRHPHLLGHRPDERRHPGLHLVGGLVGERDGQDLERADALVADEVGDAVRQHPGLARPGPRHHQERTVRVRDRVGLHRVQAGQRFEDVGTSALGCAAVGSAVLGSAVGRCHRPPHRRGAL